MKILSAVLVLSIISCSAHAQSVADEQNRAYTARNAGEISFYEAEREVLSAAILYHPEDKPLHMMIEGLAELGARYDKKEISADEYDRLRIGKIDRYNQMVRARKEAVAEQTTSNRPSFWQLLGAGVNGMNRSLSQQPINCTSIVTGNVVTQKCY